LPLQTRVLDRWPDGSVRWVLLDWQADVNAPTTYQIRVGDGGVQVAAGPALRLGHGEDGALAIDTGAACYVIRATGPFPFAEVRVGGELAIDVVRSGLRVRDETGAPHRPRVERIDTIEAGPLRAAVRLAGSLVGPTGTPLATFELDIHFFADSAATRMELTIGNPRRSAHPGGCWDLGNRGSIYLRDASFTFAAPPVEAEAVIEVSPEHGGLFQRFADPVELYQDSSGGENWRSEAHVNRHGIVPVAFRGYRLRSAGAVTSGLRATPAILLRRGHRSLGLAMECFWQNFPKAIEATADAVALGLFPAQSGDVHEIQGGEQKTHVFWATFGPDEVAEEPLAWCRSPSRARATPDWYCSSGVVPYLTTRAEDMNPKYLALVEAAIEGNDTFERKREVVDEYGWRNFGDVYGDHEAVFHDGPSPLVSHYNNQYDNLAGLAFQFLRSGDVRWWRLLRDLALHVIDIDIYHTRWDKSAYNGGLFWHTYHYVDADTGTHRSYSRNQPVNGGGPSGGHSYATGLMLHHFLTGDERSRSAAIGLARWVIDMDDGGKTIFRWLDRGDTGHATASGSLFYHGPGRAPGNSVSVLLDGHRLTGVPEFLAKAEQIIRRCIHPRDDVAARDLLDAENKWFYTMFLQALGKYLDHKEEIGQVDFMYAYARASLLCYARWMAEHERPYLERPEILEYPTETWAAQDMRKSEVFKFAAKYAPPEERDRFLERSGFFFRDSTETLAGMPTRTLARPVVLMLSNGLMHAYFQKLPETRSEVPVDLAAHDFGEPETFVPQKVRAIARLKRLVAAATIVVAMLAVLAAVWAWS
jgi:hypothetical protein